MSATIEIPTLTTERLTLRAPQMSDLDTYVEFRLSERSRLIGGPFPPETAMMSLSAIVGHWLLRGFGRWIIADRTNDQPMGIVGPYYPAEWPEPEIAWTVFGNAEGLGIAFEAANAALDFAYDVLNWPTAVSCVSVDNTRSRALAKRLGARRDGVFEHPVYGNLEIYRHVEPGQTRPTPEARQ